MTPQDKARIDRINEISALARTSWIGLLAYLAFVFVTLLGVEDADFFVPSRQTQLPLVNVSIPTASFFIFAPILTAALYVYLHIFLIKLWDTIAEAPATVRTDQERDERFALSEAIHPWLANDLATVMRGNGARPEPDRPLRWLSTLVTWALVWFAGPATLFFFWWWSGPAHSELLTLLIAACLFATIYAGSVSWYRARASLKRRKPALWHRLGRWGATTVLFMALAIVSWSRTEGGVERWADRAVDQAQTLLRPDAPFLQSCRPPDFDTGADESSLWRSQGPMPLCIDQYGVELPPDMIRERHIGASWWLPGDDNRMIRTARRLLDRWLDDDWLPLARTDLGDEALGATPSDWLDHDIARRRAREAWCRGRDIPLEACDLIGSDMDAAAELWCEEQEKESTCPDRFRAQVARFDEEWRIDRAAYLGNLTTPDLAGRDLRQADLSGTFLSAADLWRARLEGANLSGARLEGADLWRARLEGADLWRADFRNSEWAGASNRASPAHSADFRGGQDLAQAQLEDLIGDAGTLLPEAPAPDTGRPFHVWTCWPAPPEGFDNLVALFERYGNDRQAVEDEFLCPEGETLRRTGTPCPLNVPRERCTDWVRAHAYIGIER